MEVSDDRVPLSAIKDEIGSIRWASIREVTTTTAIVTTVFIALAYFVSRFDLLLVDIVELASNRPMPAAAHTPAVVAWLVSVLVFSAQIRHHRGGSDPSLMLTGATEDVRGRWPGLLLSSISAASLLVSSAVLAWSSLS